MTTMDVRQNHPEYSVQAQMLQAVKAGNVSNCTLFLAHGASATLSDAAGDTPLHIAAEWSPRCMRALAAYGAAVDAANRSGETPLALATRLHHLGAVLELVALGAHADRAVPRGSTVGLLGACLAGCPSHLSAEQVTLMMKALLSAGASPDGTASCAVSPLCLCRHPEHVQMLLAAGASIDNPPRLPSPEDVFMKQSRPDLAATVATWRRARAAGAKLVARAGNRPRLRG